VSLKAFN